MNINNTNIKAPIPLNKNTSGSKTVFTHNSGDGHVPKNHLNSKAHTINSKEDELLDAIRNWNPNKKGSNKFVPDLKISSTDANRILHDELKPYKPKKTHMEQSIEKHALVFKINKYLNSKRFGPLIKEMGIHYELKALRKMKLPQLEDIYAQIRALLGSKVTDKLIDNAVRAINKAIEINARPFYNIDGYSILINKNEEFLDCIEELKLETDIPNLTPEIRMLIICGQTAMVAHMIQNQMGNIQHTRGLNDSESPSEAESQENLSPIEEEKQEHL